MTCTSLATTASGKLLLTVIDGWCGGLTRAGAGEVDRAACLRHAPLKLFRHLQHRAPARVVGGLSLGGSEKLARGFVKLHARQLLQDRVVGDLEGDDLLRLNLKVSQELDLLKVEGASVEDPAVQSAIGFA